MLNRQTQRPFAVSEVMRTTLESLEVHGTQAGKECLAVPPLSPNVPLVRKEGKTGQKQETMMLLEILCWVAVKKLMLSHCNRDTLKFYYIAISWQLNVSYLEAAQ